MIEVISATRDIGTDRLYRVDGDTIVRARVTRTTSDAQIQNADRGMDQINFKFQCSVAKDDSGDVVEDAAGDHIIFSAEIHSITLETLSNGASLEAWIAETLEAIISKAQRKAVVLQKIRTMFPS